MFSEQGTATADATASDLAPDLGHDSLFIVTHNPCSAKGLQITGKIVVRGQALYTHRKIPKSAMVAFKM